MSSGQYLQGPFFAAIFFPLLFFEDVNVLFQPVCIHIMLKSMKDWKLHVCSMTVCPSSKSGDGVECVSLLLTEG